MLHVARVACHSDLELPESGSAATTYRGFPNPQILPAATTTTMLSNPIFFLSALSLHPRDKAPLS